MLVYFVNHHASENHLGGSELSLLQLIDDWMLLESSLQAVVVSPSSQGPFADAVEAHGWRLVGLDYGGWVLVGDPVSRLEALGRSHRDAAATRLLVEFMQREPPDLVVTNSVVAPWGAFAAASVGIPHVWFVREFADAAQGYYFPRGREATLRGIGQLSAHVFANSHAVRDALVRYIPPQRVSVAYPTMSVGEIQRSALEEPATEPFPHEAALRVVVVARLARSKGQWRVIEAVSALARRGIRVAVCFVGAAVELDADADLRNLATELGISELVTFAGEQPNPFPYVRRADIGVVASDVEAFGRATLECLVVGRPVVASRSGGTPEVVVHGRTGFLVTPDSLDELAQRLEQYATDPELLRRHTAAAVDGALEVIASSDSPHQVVSKMQHAARSDVEPLAIDITSFWDMPEPLGPWAHRVLSLRIRLQRVRHRAVRIAKNPISSLRRWRARPRGAR